MRKIICILSTVTLLVACNGEKQGGGQPSSVKNEPGAATPLSPEATAVAPATPPVTLEATRVAPVPMESPAEPLLPRRTASAPSVAPAASKSAKSKAQPEGGENDKGRISRLAATILSPAGMEPLAAVAYNTARDIPDRLEKLYCYCHCHEELGHKSLLSCYQDRHAVDCGICQNEAKQAWLDWKEGVPVEVSVKEINLMYNSGNPPPSTPIPE